MAAIAVATRSGDAEGTGEIAFEAAELDAPVLGHIVENSRLTAALLGGIRERRDLALHVPARLADVATEPGTDAHANLEGYISVTPMRADLTAHDALEALKAIE